MKRQIIYTVAAALATGTMPLTSSVVFANTTQVTVPSTTVPSKKIETAQDFIDVFCSLQNVDAKGNWLDEYTLITMLDEKNYTSILAGKAVYDSLSLDMQLEINTLIENQMAQEALKNKTEALYKSFPEMVIAAQAIDKKLNPNNYAQTVQSDTTTPETKTDDTTDTDLENSSNTESKDSQPVESPKDSTTESKDSQGTETPKDSTTEEEKNDDSKKDVEKDIETDSKEEDSRLKTEPETNSENQAKDKEATEEDTKQESEINVYPVITMAAPVAEEPMLLSLEQPEPLVAEITEQPLVETISEPVVMQPKEVNVVSAKEEDTTSKTTAQNFVDTYLRSEGGSIYVNATSWNYKNILNGLSTWNKLTSTQKNDVNAILKKQVGKTYQALLQEAQSIQFGTPNSSYTRSYVNTSTQMNAGLYGAFMGLSAGVAGFLFRKRKEWKK